MRRFSKQRAAKRAGIDEVRREFHDEFPTCMICGMEAHHVHEVEDGDLRHITELERTFWLSLCATCHREVHAKNVPADRQLAFKATMDADSIDLDRFNEVARHPVSLGDLLRAVRKVARFG